MPEKLVVAFIQVLFIFGLLLIFLVISGRLEKIYVYLTKLRYKKKSVKIEVERDKAQLLQQIIQAFDELPEKARRRYAQYLAKSQRSDGSFPQSPIIFVSLTPQDEKTYEELKQAVEEVRSRVGSIEIRLPNKSTLDKIASVNDAILATKIDNLESYLAKLEANQVTKWHVVKIVLAITGAIATILSLIISMLTK
jgi:hypothetical protein